MMPTIEPYFVRSARRAQPHLPTALRDRAGVYLDQEAQHFAQHVVFNRVLHARYPRLARTEAVMASIYRWLDDTRSLEFSCAFAAASETMAYSAARWAADHRLELFGGADEVPASLFLWHLAEEVEHKSVAFDIHRHLTTKTSQPFRTWIRYLAAMIVALLLVIAFVGWGTTVMLFSEKRLHHPTAWVRLIRWSVIFAFELLTNLTISLLPGFHPDDFVDPLWYEVWLRQYDAAAGTFPLWTDVRGDLGIPTQHPSDAGGLDRPRTCEDRQGTVRPSGLSRG